MQETDEFLSMFTKREPICCFCVFHFPSVYFMCTTLCTLRKFFACTVSGVFSQIFILILCVKITNGEQSEPVLRWRAQGLRGSDIFLEKGDLTVSFVQIYRFSIRLFWFAALNVDLTHPSQVNCNICSVKFRKPVQTMQNWRHSKHFAQHSSMSN